MLHEYDIAKEWRHYQNCVVDSILKIFFVDFCAFHFCLELEWSGSSEHYIWMLVITCFCEKHSFAACLMKFSINSYIRFTLAEYDMGIVGITVFLLFLREYSESFVQKPSWHSDIPLRAFSLEYFIH